MPRVGDVLVLLLWDGGMLGRGMVVLSALGFALALVALAALLLGRSDPKAWGVVTLIVTALHMGLGAGATLAGRVQADQALEALSPGVSRERIQRQGYLEARLFSQGALVLGAFPLVAGAAGIVAASARRSRSRMTRPAGAALGARPGRTDRVGGRRNAVSLPNVVLVIALLAALGALWGVAARVPDPYMEVGCIVQRGCTLAGWAPNVEAGARKA